mgnify:FL=1
MVRYGTRYVHAQDWVKFGRLSMLCGLLDWIGATLGYGQSQYADKVRSCNIFKPVMPHYYLSIFVIRHRRIDRNCGWSMERIVRTEIRLETRRRLT